MTYAQTIEWLTQINEKEDGEWIGNISTHNLECLFKRDLVEWQEREYFVLTKFGQEVLAAHNDAAKSRAKSNFVPMG